MNKREEIINILLNTKGTFFKVSFVKLNGEVRELRGRLGVKKYLKKKGDNSLSNGLRIIKDKFITVYDVVKRDYRMVNIETIFELSANRQKYKFATTK